MFFEYLSIIIGKLKEKIGKQVDSNRKNQPNFENRIMVRVRVMG